MPTRSAAPPVDRAAGQAFHAGGGPRGSGDRQIVAFDAGLDELVTDVVAAADMQGRAARLS
jgi:hypothetical protein